MSPLFLLMLSLAGPVLAQDDPRPPATAPTESAGPPAEPSGDAPPPP
ncbi:MAG: MotA/TolQ/ExbB proton channel family protein, partial [Deltaproteobacteria bacterium]